MATDLKFRFSFHLRQFLVLMFFSWTMVGCFIAYQYYREKSLKIESINTMLQVNNSHILDAIETQGAPLADIGQSNMNLKDLRITIMDIHGNVIYDNAFKPNTVSDNHISRPEIAQALATGKGYTVMRKSKTTDTPFFYSATLGKTHIVRSAVPYDHSLHQMLTTDGAFLWIMLGITLVFSIIGYFVTWRAGVVISRLNDFAARAEKGERIYADLAFPDNELGSISSHIVRLYSRLQEAIVERDRQHEIAIHEEQEKIRIKRQLTNNINHELKTPVSAIQVCLETLLDHPELSDEKRIEFLRRSYDNTSRLRSLLDDVSLITRMEDGSQAIEMSTVSLSEIISDAVDESEIAHPDSNMEIHVETAGDLPLTANAGILLSVFRNLIDNAIAYSGGSKIEIKTADDGDFYSVIFADNGIGVAKEHLPHLFERFYRIDKGRSRKMGGTGLGLSIVKNAIILHGGTIEAINRRDGGLEFRFSLKKYN